MARLKQELVLIHPKLHKFQHPQTDMLTAQGAMRSETDTLPVLSA